MNYGRDMRIPSLRTVTAPLAVVVFVLAGCGAQDSAPSTTEAGPCSVIENGTPVAKAPPEPSPGSAATSRNISTNPEVATGYRKDMTAVRTTHYAVVTANPLATQAACEVLNKGGTAADALVTAQAVLGLVEPQSSGIGGGGFLLYYDAAARSVQAYDGREVAPAAATENYLRWISDADRTEPKPDARASGRSIGVPGILRMLSDVHTEHGKTTWRDLFTPAVTMADSGFDISPRLAAAIADAAPQLRVDPDAAEYFLNPDGSPMAAGTRLTNPAYSKTLGTIASDPNSFYTGDIARDIVAAAADTSGGRTPSPMTRRRTWPVTPPRHANRCARRTAGRRSAMPPPSSGGIAVAATLGMLEHFAMGDHKPTDIDLNGGSPTVMGVHLISEAERLAYADRDKYVADTDSSVARRLAQHIARQRLPRGPGRADIRAAHHGHRRAGRVRPGDHAVRAGPRARNQPVSIVDSQGNAAALTTTMESAFGSFHMVDGFILNNQLTDFSAEPDRAGRRARAPTDPAWQASAQHDGPDAGVRAGRVGARSAVRGAGLPGGAVIIQFVVKTVVGMLDWGLDPQQAVSAVDFGAANSPKTNVGGEHRTSTRPTTATTTRWCRGCANSGTRSTWPTSPAGCPRSCATTRVDRRRRSASRGAGDGRHPVTARRSGSPGSPSRTGVTIFAGVRLRALSDSLGEHDPQYQTGVQLHRSAVAPQAARPRAVRRADRQPAGGTDCGPAGEHRYRLPVLAVARTPRPGDKGWRNRWSPPRWTGRETGAARMVTLRVAADNTAARGVYESLGFTQSFNRKHKRPRVKSR